MHMPQAEAIADEEEIITVTDFGTEFARDFGEGGGGSAEATNVGATAATGFDGEQDDEDTRDTVLSDRAETRIVQIEFTREEVNGNQAKAATQMLSRQARLLGDVDVDMNVILFVSEFDKGMTDAPHILCKVIKIKDNVYQLACEVGILNGYFARNAFQLGSSNIDYPEADMTAKCSVREAVTKLSLGTGQGVVRCDCTQTCQRKCKCKKEGLVCKSRCHQKSKACTNK